VTALHVPGAVVTSQALQLSVQVASQHTVSTQCMDLQSPSVPQGMPLPRAPHEPL
jgi:hypothetical protein